jgi:hypothetical protein
MLSFGHLSNWRKEVWNSLRTTTGGVRAESYVTHVACCSPRFAHVAAHDVHRISGRADELTLTVGPVISVRL